MNRRDRGIRRRTCDSCRDLHRTPLDGKRRIVVHQIPGSTDVLDLVDKASAAVRDLYDGQFLYEKVSVVVNAGTTRRQPSCRRAGPDHRAQRRCGKPTIVGGEFGYADISLDNRDKTGSPEYFPLLMGLAEGGGFD